MKASRSTILLSLLLCLTCKDAVGPRALAFQTDSTAYTLVPTAVGYEATIGYVFTNPTPSPVHFPTCWGGIALQLEKFVDGAWVVAWTPWLLMCSGPPIVVLPYAQYRTAVHVTHCFPLNNCGPSFTVPEIPGEYRIVWTAVGTSHGWALSLEQRVSNTFTISTPSP